MAQGRTKADGSAVGTRLPWQSRGGATPYSASSTLRSPPFKQVVCAAGGGVGGSVYIMRLCACVHGLYPPPWLPEPEKPRSLPTDINGDAFDDKLYFQSLLKVTSPLVPGRSVSLVDRSEAWPR